MGLWFLCGVDAVYGITITTTTTPNQQQQNKQNESHEFSFK